jgi:membrane protein DedA with SNARE-associated domain
LQTITDLVNHYGYIVLFCALALELIAFPLPGDFTMTYCGFLIYQSKMNWLLSILSATAGTVVGITISYFLGMKLGEGFFRKYGSYVHFGPDKLEKTSKWFKTYGNKLLLLAYFIPGVRHVTGYFSGITGISYRKFALYAYLGALIWTSTFISLGKFLGSNWDAFHTYLKRYIVICILIIVLILIIIYAYNNHKTLIIKFTYGTLNKTMVTFNSMGKIKILIATIAIALLVFFVLLIGLIQDYLRHEFDRFDTIVSSLVKAIFTKEWSFGISLFDNVTSTNILLPVTILVIIWIIIKNVDKSLEAQFLIITIGGGEILQLILANIFKRIPPSSLVQIATTQYTFPSNESFMAIVSYGFIAFLIARHVKRVWFKTTIIAATILICIFAGINPLFYQTEYPSDVYAGYILGGVWLTLNIILLELYRIIPRIQSKND